MYNVYKQNALIRIGNTYTYNTVTGDDLLNSTPLYLSYYHTKWAFVNAIDYNQQMDIHQCVDCKSFSRATNTVTHQAVKSFHIDIQLLS